MMIQLMLSHTHVNMHTHYSQLKKTKKETCINTDQQQKVGLSHKGKIMAKITYKDAKTGKTLTEKELEQKLKKYLKPKVVKKGKTYHLEYPISKTKYEEGK